MSVMPQTPAEWRDYDADRLMARVIESRKELEKTHSFSKLVEMQIAWDNRIDKPEENGKN